MSRFAPVGGVRRALAAAAALIGAAAIPSVAHAHFILQAPENWKEMDDQGNPQKMAPCGNETATTMETNVVTPFMAGEEITITIDETITHGGHYRVALAESDMGDLPAD